MTRKHILPIAAIAIVMLILSALAVALMPFWVGLLLVDPNITKPIQDRVMQNITRQIMRGMMRV